MTHEARPHLIPVRLINNSTGSPLGLRVNSPRGSIVIKAIQALKMLSNFVNAASCSSWQTHRLLPSPPPKEKKYKQEPRWQASNCQHSLSQYQKRLLGLRDFTIWSCFFLFRDSRERLVNEPRVVMSWYALTSMATSQDFFCMQIHQLRSSLVKISRRSFEEVKMALVLNQVRCYFFDSLFEFFCWTVNMLSATKQFWY